jgi:hypothetical protein
MGSDLQLITLDPGHFHAALFHKETLPGISPVVRVFAPLGPDLTLHLNRMAGFNARAERPTDWRLEIYAGPDFLDRMLEQEPGKIVVLSGRNKPKIKRIRASVERGFHVLADKPWIIESSDFPELEKTVRSPAAKRVVAYDAMTQRFEVTCLLARELVQDAAIFGTPAAGSLQQPSVLMESSHALLKEVAGAVNLRPDWFFDIRQQGESLADAGPHLVDQVTWTLFPEKVLDYAGDINVLQAERWPVKISRSQFETVTGRRGFPAFLQDSLKDDQLQFWCNNRLDYTVRGQHVRIVTSWEFNPGGGKDSHRTVFVGTGARVEILCGQAQGFVPELYVKARDVDPNRSLRAALDRKIADLRLQYPGLELESAPDGFKLVIPAALHSSHEAHFAALTGRFLSYVRAPQSVPTWETSHLLAKYYVTTRGVALGRKAARRESTSGTRVDR